MLLKVLLATGTTGLLISFPSRSYGQCYKDNGPMSTIERQTDRKGSDVARFEYRYEGPYSFPGDPREGRCQSDCQKTADCYSWTYLYPSTSTGSGYCYLKNSTPSATFNSRTSSGVKYEDHIDRPGGDFQVLDASDVTICDDDCKKNSNCVAFTWVKSTHRCWLKSSIPAPFFNWDTVSTYYNEYCIK
jgi:hypothetical protein